MATETTTPPAPATQSSTPPPAPAETTATTPPAADPAASTFTATPMFEQAGSTRSATLDESLSSALRARQEWISAGRKGPEPAKPGEQAAPKEEKPAEPAAEKPADKPPEAEAKPAEKPAELAKEENPKDAVAEKLAELTRNMQSQTHERKRLADERKALEAERQQWGGAVQKLNTIVEAAKKDPLTAVEQLLGTEAVEGDLVFRLLDRLKAKNGEATEETPEQQAEKIAKLASARIEAERLEREKAAAAQRETEEEANKAAYFAGLNKHLAGNADKYSLLASEGVDTDEIDKYIRSSHRQTGTVPGPDAILEHFEKALESRALRLQEVLTKRKGANPAPEPPPPAPAPVAPAPKPPVDTRGRASVPKKATNFEEDRLARLAALGRR